jgi:hypothetical protein
MHLSRSRHTVERDSAMKLAARRRVEAVSDELELTVANGFDDWRVVFAAINLRKRPEMPDLLDQAFVRVRTRTTLVVDEPVEPAMIPINGALPELDRRLEHPVDATVAIAEKRHIGAPGASEPAKGECEPGQAHAS